MFLSNDLNSSVNRRPHILWLTPFLPSPPHDGGKKRMHALLMGLARDWRITVLSYINHPLEAFAARDLEAAGIVVRCVPRVPAAAPPELELPGMTYPFYCPGMLEALHAVILRDPPDAVQIEFFQMAPIGLAVPSSIPIFYTEHDAGHFSKRRSYLPPSEDGGFALELKRRKKLLRLVLRRAHRAVTMSDWDARRLRALRPQAGLTTIPMGVHCSEFISPSANQRTPGRILFVGSYPHFPNVDGARFLTRKVMPYVWSRMPQAHLVLAGSSPTPEIRALAGPRVAVTGTREDLRGEFFSADVFAAPIRLGCGMKTKILEAFAAGLPVVALKETLRGIPARDGQEVLSAKNENDFSRRLVRLLQDATLREKLSRCARRLARRFDWSSAVAAQDELYERALGRKRVCRAMEKVLQ